MGVKRPSGERGALYDELADILKQLNMDDLRILRAEALHVRRFFPRGRPMPPNGRERVWPYRRIALLGMCYSAVAFCAALIMLGAIQVVPMSSGLVAVGPLLLGLVAAGNLIAFGVRVIGK